MKRISILLFVIVIALVSCKKVPEVNKEYVDVECELITVGTTTATIQCDYEYIATLKKAYLYYGEGEDATDMNVAEMSVVQKTLYVELTGLKENTTYSYYYEFVNGFNTMKSAVKVFKTEASPTTVTLPTVVTAEVTEMTANSAKGGGEVTNDGGAEVTERGICWSTNTNPTISDNYMSAGAGSGTFTATITGLNASTTYHVRAYATNSAGTAYGLDKVFTTFSGGGGGSGDHDYVDLGLPSGTLWATCNVGANSPEDYGDYFAWAEIETKTVYDWSTYKYCNGNSNALTKYCYDPIFGNNGFVDTLTVLQPDDDAVIVNWGDDWRMPTADQWIELKNNTSRAWVSQNGVNGCLFSASNGNSVFLPAAGSRKDNEFINVGIFGSYWTATLEVIDTDDPRDASVSHFASNYHVVYGSIRSLGNPIRPVRK